jgi:hypothetical protein
MKSAIAGGQRVTSLSMIRIEKKDKWIPALDSEVFNEKIHLQSVQKILEDSDEVQEYIAFVRITKFNDSFGLIGYV